MKKNKKDLQLIQLKTFGINKPKFTDKECILVPHKSTAEGFITPNGNINTFYSILTSEKDIKIYKRYPMGTHVVSYKASDFEMCKNVLAVLRLKYFTNILKYEDILRYRYTSAYDKKLEQEKEKLRLFDIASKELLKQYEHG